MATAEKTEEQILAEIEAEDQREGAKLAEKMAKYVKLSDGHSATCGSQIWLLFHAEEKLQEVARVLKSDGFRRLEAFKSPEDCPEQLQYSLIVSVVEVGGKHAKRLSEILSGMGVNPAVVFDCFDGRILVTLDEHSKKRRWDAFCEMCRQAGIGSPVRRTESAYRNPIEVNEVFTVLFQAS